VVHVEPLGVFDGDEGYAALGDCGNDSAHVDGLAVQDEHKLVVFTERR
jgi:hypothetical protein